MLNTRPSLTLALALPLLAAGPSPAIEAADVAEIVAHLASPELAGRQAGTPEGRAAAEWIAARLAAAGADPGAADGAWFQEFDLAVGVAERHSVLTVETGEGLFVVTLDEGFAPLVWSADGRVVGPVWFAGHGISAPDAGWDDWAGVDLEGGVAVVLRGMPDLEEGHPLLEEDRSGLGHVNTKIQVAKDHGAGAVLFADPLPGQGLKQPPGSFRYGRSPLPAGLVSWELFMRLFPDLGTPEDAATEPAQPVAGSGELVFETRQVVLEGTGANVLGHMAGPEGSPLVVVGAHFDHLGLGEEFTMAPDLAGQPHVGADDNASGVALVLELAHHYGAMAHGDRPASFLFALFDGEEMGLLGSQLLVSDFPGDLARVSFMLNADMVGRYADSGVLLVGGEGTAAEWEGLLATTAPDGLVVEPSADGAGRSDHVAFLAEGVPALFLFTGAHSDYHKPSDTPDKVDAAGVAAIASYAVELVDELAPRGPFTFVAPPAQDAGRGGYGPWFGSVPDFGQHDLPGYWISGTSAGSPAEAAGLLGGDRVVKVDGRYTDDIYGFTAVLRTLRPGDVVEVVIGRGIFRFTTLLTLGRRD